MEMNSEKFKKTVCPRCDKEFTCFLFRNCTCEEIEIPDELLEEIQMHYTECICKDCIREIVKQKQAIVK